MIYVEFISRRPEVSPREFYEGVAVGQEGWDSSHAEDQLVWSAGRTWRLGPTPEYLGVWSSPAFGLNRLDDWDRIFRGGHADVHENVFRKVARIEAAGCYQPLRTPLPARRGTYYAEFFRPAADDATIQGFFEQRARQHARFTLNLLLHRIGRLAPEPGGIAVWTIPDFAALDEIVAELDAIQQPIELTAAGTYADIGQEIL